MKQQHIPVTDLAQIFARRPLYAFSDIEARALRPFFTNFIQSVFFMHALPMTVGDVLLAMYSRMKNPRGLRGVFVDSFLPQFLASSLLEAREFANPQEFLKAKDLSSLDAFVSYSAETLRAFQEFLEALARDPEYVETFSSSTKVKAFLSMWLDRYGHNSIARMAGGIWLCFEEISILAAKSVEWTRPGTGYIELSTRYVDMDADEVWPIAEALAEYGVPKAMVHDILAQSFRQYRELGEDLTGEFPAFLRRVYEHLYADDPKSLEMGIFGETCDALGNFLPAAALTSVGVCTNGESLPQIVKHLILDNTPETLALAELVIDEAKKLGLDQFLRHMEPTGWESDSWRYLVHGPFAPLVSEITKLRESSVFSGALPLPPAVWVEECLAELLKCQGDLGAHAPFELALGRLLREQQPSRGEYGKLPGHFESIGVAFRGIMSFRSWRDLQRQGLCAHYRTYLTPELGFYNYNKPAPQTFMKACYNLHARNRALYAEMCAHSVPEGLMQYPLALGNMVGFQIVGNLRQMEFACWQRTKPSVNYEVRGIFLGMERELRKAYPWWRRISRADMVPGYVFARGKKEVPLSGARVTA